MLIILGVMLSGWAAAYFGTKAYLQESWPWLLAILSGICSIVTAGLLVIAFYHAIACGIIAVIAGAIATGITAWFCWDMADYENEDDDLR